MEDKETTKCENCIHNEVCNSKHKEEYERNILTPVLSNIKKLKSEICKYHQPKLHKDSVVLTKREFLDNCELIYEKGYKQALADLEKDGKVVLTKEERSKLIHIDTLFYAQKTKKSQKNSVLR